MRALGLSRTLSAKFEATLLVATSAERPGQLFVFVRAFRSVPISATQLLPLLCGTFLDIAHPAMDIDASLAGNASQSRQKRVLPSRSRRGGPGVGNCDVDVMILNAQLNKCTRTVLDRLLVVLMPP